MPEKTVTVGVHITDLVDVEEPNQKRASIVFFGPQGQEIIHLRSQRDSIIVGRLYPADVCIDDPSLSRQLVG